MKFNRLSEFLAISADGNYELRKAEHPGSRKPFFNVWYLPTEKHVAAGFNRTAVAKECDGHAERQRLL